MPVVTIGVPFFNPGRYLVDAVKSVFAQSFKDWELLLIDDGSTDGSLELVRRIDDRRVRVVSDGANRGLAWRLNQIAEMANGEYIVRFDADDMMAPHRIERVLHALKEADGDDVVMHHAAFIINERNEVVSLLESAQTVSAMRLFKTGGIIHATIAAPKRWFLANPYSTRFRRAEDRELFVRCAPKTKFQYINEPLYFYRFVRKTPVHAYSRSYKEERTILLQYGPARIGWIWTGYLVGRSLVKSAVLRVASSAGWADQLYQAKLPRIERNRLEIGEAWIRTVSATVVPGWQ
jgi:glycosyltransferase involved in cell wall biosynthesis